MMCSASGEMMKFVIIFKAGKKGLNEKELASFRAYPKVVVAWSDSSYITEKIWMDCIIDKQLYLI